MKLNADMTVRDLIAHYPDATQFFLRRRMRCVGCPTEGFHTLEEVARIHGDFPDRFLNELGRSMGAERKSATERMDSLSEASRKGDCRMLSCPANLKTSSEEKTTGFTLELAPGKGIMDKVG